MKSRVQNNLIKSSFIQHELSMYCMLEFMNSVTEEPAQNKGGLFIFSGHKSMERKYIPMEQQQD